MTETVSQKKELQDAARSTLEAKPFDKLAHCPPRIDKFGYNLAPKIGAKPEGPNMLNDNTVQIPSWWAPNGCEKKTKTELLENRRAQLRPDISYDLDGDGIVGNRDYVISKLYDVDQDGKLNAQERKNALEAVKNGVEDKFFWNIEQAGAQRPFRIKQTRGVFVDCEDFLPVTSTYPEHPLSKQVPQHKNIQEVKGTRLTALKKDVAEKSAAFHARASKPVNNDSRIPDEGYCANPRRTSIKERDSENKRNARTKAGLTEHTEHPKEVAGEIGLDWQHQPKFKTTQELKEYRAAQNLSDLKALEPNVGNLKDTEQRLNAREMCYLRMQQKAAATRTKTEIVAQRRKEMVEENTRKFGEQTIGIHGQELPQYSATQDSKHWWQYHPRGQPNIQSQLLLKQSHKYWAVNDEMLLADGKHTSGPEDIFKQGRVQKPGPKEVPCKVNQMHHCNNQEMIVHPDVTKGYKTQIKWSSQEQEFAGKDRIIDKLVARAVDCERKEEERLQKLEAFHNQRKRGTQGENQSSIQSISQPTQQLRLNKGGDNDKSSQNKIAAKSTAQPSQQKSQIDAYGETNVSQTARNLKTEPMNRTLIGRMNCKVAQPAGATMTKKGGEDNGPQASMRTAVTMGDTAHNKTQASMMNSGMGVTSPFKDAMAKGVVSGMGMLTF